MDKLSRYELDERSAEARALLHSPVFLLVLDQMEHEAIQALRGAHIGDLTAQAAHAKLLAVGDIKASLEAFIVDEKLANRPRTKFGVF